MAEEKEEVKKEKPNRFAKNIPLLLFLILGFAIIIYHESIVEYIEDMISPRDTRPTIATVVDMSGKVRVKAAKSLRYKNSKEHQELKDQDILTTDANSRVKISFKSGFEIQVEPNSLIVIENPKKDDQGRIQITFLQGDFKVIKTGQANQVIVSKDKAFQDLAGREPQKPLQIDLSTPPPTLEINTDLKSPMIEAQKLEEKKKILAEKEKKKGPKKPKQTLSDEYIAQIVSSQKPFFNRCYAQHLRLNPDSKGQIHLSFTIDSQGRVASVSLIQSTLSDPQLEKCTMSVIERCHFKTFDGDPIVVNYPINFE